MRYDPTYKIKNNRCLNCDKPIDKRSKRCRKCHINKTMKGRKQSEKSKKLIRLSKLGSKNPIWKGNKVGYEALHEWVKRHKLKPKICECCCKEKPLDLANISQEYKRDIKDFEWLCRKCHMTKDDRIKKLRNYHVKKEIRNCGQQTTQ